MNDNGSTLYAEIEAAATKASGLNAIEREKFAARARALGGKDLEIFVHGLIDQYRLQPPKAEERSEAKEYIDSLATRPLPTQSVTVNISGSVNAGPATHMVKNTTPPWWQTDKTPWAGIAILAVLFLIVGAVLAATAETTASEVGSYVCYVLATTLVAFGLLRSSGFVKAKQYQFGGAAALMVVLLTMLLYFVRGPQKDLSGIVYLDGSPPAVVTVYLLETETRDNVRELKERDQGKFEFRNVIGLKGAEVAFKIMIPGRPDEVIRSRYVSGELIRLNCETKK